MMYEVPLRPLSDCGKIITGKTPSSKVDGAFGAGTLFVTPRDLDSRKYVTSTERELSSVGVDSVKKNVVPANSVLVSCIGSDMGKVALIKSDAVTNQQINSIIVDTENHNPEYVYYALLPLKNELKNAAGGTTMPILNKTDFGKFEIPLPELEAQNEIVRIITCLDSKISNNTAMNATLEKIAQRIFKSWFVDFDPVKANAEGLPFDGLSPEIQALFPNEFEESELGMIPKGWEVDTLQSQIDILNGYAFKSKDYSNEGIFVLRTKNFESGIVKKRADDVLLPNEFSMSHEKYLCKPFDYHLVMVGASIGDRGLIFEHQLPALRNQNMWCFRAKSESILSQYYIKYLLDSLVESRLGMASGSAREFFRKSDFGEIKTVFPDEKLLNKYNETIKPILERISTNEAQIETLTKIRDKLLPRLISGKITIQKAEELLEEAS
ncbi:restriction endonuclease subunit S [Pseudoalteromonas sp. MQS005]|uniref:restriction endonuclease subunit S n=1 Tax=Pseudoalteromonas sp. MQS005 TaxID=1854052 RepID=UPI0007E50EE6|nr:restriction endonuclease subunit S [Pseudoalteromonas sp. MQS005]